MSGLGLAHALLNHGLPVTSLTLFERSQPGAGASGLPGGLMHPSPGRSLQPKPHYWESFQYSHHWLKTWQKTTRERLFNELRLLRPASTPELQQRFARSSSRLPAALADQIYRLKTDSVIDRRFTLPEHTWEIRTALHVEMPQLLNRMLSALHQAGLTIRTAAVQAFEFAGKQWHLTSATGTESFDILVLCPGASLRDWFPDLPLETVRGELLLLRHPNFHGLTHALSSHGYLIPCGADRALAGPTFYPEAQPRSPEWSIATIQHQLRAYVPWIEQAEVLNLWSGCRALVRHDREPLAGPVPGQIGLFVLGALGAKGLLLMPRLATQLSLMLLEGQTESIPTAFSTRRLPEKHWQRSGPCS
jgi:tRNA 5-methylaminomethyl-2-thiouridine biosynthesis bifunctional protein